MRTGETLEDPLTRLSGGPRADQLRLGAGRAVGRGIAYLAEKQGNDGVWEEERYTATGFPRVFYLRYHGYRRFFPLWAMARYRNLKNGNSRVVSFGM